MIPDCKEASYCCWRLRDCARRSRDEALDQAWAAVRAALRRNAMGQQSEKCALEAIDRIRGRSSALLPGGNEHGKEPPQGMPVSVR